MIEETWNAYRRVMLPESATKLLVSEFKRAFYAGAAATFCAVTADDAGVGTLLELRAEIDKFTEVEAQ